MPEFNVCFWHKADNPIAPELVRYWSNSGHALYPITPETTAPDRLVRGRQSQLKTAQARTKAAPDGLAESAESFLQGLHSNTLTS